MVLPEGLVLNSNERVYKIFRHVFIFDYLTVFGIEDIIYLLAFVIVDYRGSINHSIDILIITAPARIAEEVAADIEGTEIKGIWNFGMTEFHIKGVKVINVHLSDSLHALCYYINHPD